jgi:hypothetical protein
MELQGYVQSASRLLLSPSLHQNTCSPIPFYPLVFLTSCFGTEIDAPVPEIAACYGSDMTEHALNHRFRRLKAQVVIIREARDQKGGGLDMKNMIVDESALPQTKEAVDKPNIAKYFGQSTPDGIQFQFRGIKKDADLLRQTHADGGNVANCLDIPGGSSLPATPSKQTMPRRGGSRSGGTGRGKRKPPVTFIKRSSSDDEEEPEECEDWSDKDETPSKRAKTGELPGQRNGTPSRRAAVKAVDTIADASAKLQDVEVISDSETPVSTAPARAPARIPAPAPSPIRASVPAPAPAPPSTVAPSSIFGPISTGSSLDPFSDLGHDSFMGMADENDILNTNLYFDEGFI